MSTAVHAQPAPAVAMAAARGVRLRHALHAEWTKLRTVSGPAWLLLGVVALTIAVSAAAAGATHCPQNLTCPVDTTKLSLTGIQFGQAVVAILAVLAFCNEYSTGMIRITLAAMPRSSQAGPETVRSLVHSACSAWRRLAPRAAVATVGAGCVAVAVLMRLAAAA